MPKREDCQVCEALLDAEGECSNQECTTHPCLQCGRRVCDCPPLTASQKVDLRIERDRHKLNQALTRAANERLFPTRPELPSEKRFQANLARRTKVTLSERQAKTETQFEKKIRPRND